MCGTPGEPVLGCPQQAHKVTLVRVAGLASSKIPTVRLRTTTEAAFDERIGNFAGYAED